MILRQIGSNQTELSLNNGNSIFFSYETPVAGYSDDIGFFRTATYYSKTTSRHINAYLGDVKASEVPDQYICLLYTSPSPRDLSTSRMPSSA